MAKPGRDPECAAGQGLHTSLICPGVLTFPTLLHIESIALLGLLRRGQGAGASRGRSRGPPAMSPDVRPGQTVPVSRTCTRPFAPTSSHPHLRLAKPTGRVPAVVYHPVGLDDSAGPTRNSRARSGGNGLHTTLGGESSRVLPESLPQVRSGWANVFRSAAIGRDSSSFWTRTASGRPKNPYALTSGP